MIKFSFLLPTRGRPALLKRFFESVLATAEAPEALEVVLGIDDDQESLAVEEPRLTIRRCVVPKGSTLGFIYNECFKLSRGRIVCLMNDDVIVRTKNWDRVVYDLYERFDDEVALVHTNDLLFGDKLCTFPIRSRRACEAIGVTPADYRRYRIDDHVYDTYNILAHLGHKRIFYLPEVVFEHDNFAHEAHGEGEIFKSGDGKFYIPDQGIIGKDALLYDELLETRKSDALALCRLIDLNEAGKREQEYRRRLALVVDSRSYRQSDFSIVLPGAGMETPGSIEEALPSDAPELIEGYRDFNIVRYGNRFHCLDKSIGQIDLPTEDEHRLNGFASERRYVCAATLHEAKYLIDRVLDSSEEDMRDAGEIAHPTTEIEGARTEIAALTQTTTRQESEIRGLKATLDEERVKQREAVAGLVERLKAVKAKLKQDEARLMLEREAKAEAEFMASALINELERAKKRLDALEMDGRASQTALAARTQELYEDKLLMAALTAALKNNQGGA
ncbi:MAG: hypothetical protein HY886_02825 [Deltaproteobacteria bacterium]|nr:hypothetical protein [Deltaproteobacteria bacterium]